MLLDKLTHDASCPLLELGALTSLQEHVGLLRVESVLSCMNLDGHLDARDVVFSIAFIVKEHEGTET
jgi:hypothetical protein